MAHLPAWLQRVLGGVVVVWCLLAAVSSARVSLARGQDPMARLEAEFRPLAPHLPPFGDVGYLETYRGGADPEAVRTHYAAQYALAPRVVIGRVGPEFLIVARDTANPDGDSRLAGYREVAAFPSGHRLFRRTP